MSNNDVSVTVNSGDPDALVAAATMLLTLAGKVPTIELADTVLAANSNGFTAEELEPVVELTVPSIAEQVMSATAPPSIAEQVMSATAPPSIAEQVMSATAPAAPTGVQLDADGLPWDARIHSSGKTINKGDGRWKAKKGIDKAVKEQIENELRAVLAAPAPAAPAPAAPAPAAPAPAAPAPAAPAPAAPAPAAPESMTFQDLLKGCGELMSNGKIAMPAILEVLTDNGLPADMKSVQHRPDLIPTLWSAIQAQANG